VVGARVVVGVAAVVGGVVGGAVVAEAVVEGEVDDGVTGVVVEELDGRSSPQPAATASGTRATATTTRRRVGVVLQERITDLLA
jgi:hypothetical protein